MATPDNNPTLTQAQNAAYLQANPNAFGNAATTAPTTATPTTTAAPLANGQQPGSPQTGVQVPATTTPTAPTTPVAPTTAPQGLQMPTNGANLVYDPISNSQVTPAEKALNATKAATPQAPQTQGEVGNQVTTAIDQNTPPQPQDTSTPNVDAFFQNNQTLVQQTQDLMDFLSPPAQLQQINDLATKISGEQNALTGLNTQAMNLDNLMSGQEDSVRQEIQASGSGLATEQQIRNLSAARNHSLLLNQQVLQQKISTAQQAIANDISLLGQEKDMANTQFNQRSQIYQMVQQNQQNQLNAAKDTIKTILSQPGGLQMYANDPKQASYAEQILGMQPDTLARLAQQQENQTNLAVIQQAGITTAFANQGGTIINARTGKAYSTPDQFFKAAGVSSFDEATKKGLISNLVSPQAMDMQLKQAQINQIPLDNALKQAQIANSKASTANIYSEIQIRADAANVDKQQQALEQQYRQILVKEVSSRSGTIGTEDAKIAQANHMAALINQYYDPKTGNYNIPTSQYGELVLGLAGMISKTGTPTDNQIDTINQKTAKGDIAGAISYITGTPQTGNTQAIIKNLIDSINRQAETAVTNREAGVNVLRGLAPTDLDPKREQQLEAATLMPFNGIQGTNTANSSLGTTIMTDSNGQQWAVPNDKVNIFKQNGYK